MIRMLDLFCGAGGAAMGYHRAGIDEIVGVDVIHQKNYPFQFIQMDALEYLDAYGIEFDVIHASPPCQAYSSLTEHQENHADLYKPVRDLLHLVDRPWIIENVIGAPYESGVVLCGSMFEMIVRRHRNFETSFEVPVLQCQHKQQGKVITVAGHAGRKDGGTNPSKHSWKGFHHLWPQYMDMIWASPYEASQGIPPAYTEYIGNSFLIR